MATESEARERAIAALTSLLVFAQPDETGVAIANLLAQLLHNDGVGIHKPQVAQAQSLKLPENVVRAFTAFILRGFQTAAVRHLSCANASICQLALDLASNSLMRCCKTRSKYRASSVSILPKFVNRGEIGDEEAASRYNDEAINKSIHDQLLNILDFLKDFVPRLPISFCVSMPFRCANFMLFLVGDCEQISNAAKDVLLIVFANSYQSKASLVLSSSDNRDDEREILRAAFTQSLLKLASNTAILHHKNNALAIWLRLASLQLRPWQLHPAPGSTYWQVLHDLLSKGSRQQQKLGIAILSKSSNQIAEDIAASHVLKHNTDFSRNFQHEVLRFATVYETMILSGYINQVQACLSDLDLLCSISSALNPSWIVSLLHAGLQNTTHESVRNTLGHWVVHSNSHFFSLALNTAEFLESTFLPWASRASLYHESLITHPNGLVQCTFGDTLVRFLSNIAQSSQHKESIVERILKFLVAGQNSIFPFAKVCILEALTICLETNNTTAGGPIIVELASLLPDLNAKDVTGSLISLQTRAIRRIVGCNAYPDREAAAAKELEISSAENEREDDSIFAYCSFKDSKRERSLELNLPDPSIADENLSQLERFVEYIHASTSAGHRSAAVISTCEFLYGTLQSLPNDYRVLINRADGITKTLKTIWSSLESASFPKANTRWMVSVAFHPKCIELTSMSSKLATVLGEIAVGLLELSKSRIYIFSSLATSLRVAFLFVKPSENLPLTKLVELWANRPPQTGSAMVLERISAGKLKNTFEDSTMSFELYLGKSEGFGHACFFDLLNSLPVGAHWDLCFRQLLDSLLRPWIEQKQPVPIITPWKTTIQLQVILLAFERLLPKLASHDISLYLEKLYSLLKIEPLPRFRFLLEWIVLRVLQKQPARHDFVFNQLSSASVASEISNPKFVASMLKLSQQLLLLPDAEESWALQVMTATATLASSQRIQVLYEAKGIFPGLWRLSINRSWKSITSNCAFRRMNDHVQNLARFKSPPTARRLEQFDLLSNHNLTFLVQGPYLAIEPKDRQLTTRQDIVAVRNDSAADITTHLLPLGTIPNATEENSQEPGTMKRAEPEAKSKIPLQTKSISLQAERESAKFYEPTKNVIVVASLVESVFNLGGISRTSEIFGAQTLKINDIKLTRNKEFRSVSVSSDLWLNIEELAVRHMATYIQGCKNDGYKVVGIEQTDTSKTLGAEDCVLPERLVFVLGSEREGIPADLLSEMDMCVEIKQFGVTRSMNVQNALSIALYEYHRQHSRIYE